MSGDVGKSVYGLYVSIKESLADGNTDITQEEEAVVFLWEYVERLVDEKNALEKLLDVQKQITAHYVHQLDLNHSKAVKAERGTTVLSAAELTKLVEAHDGVTTE